MARGKIDLELHTDYLLSIFGAATATGLSAMVDGEVSHDRVSRFLAQRVTTRPETYGCKSSPQSGRSKTPRVS